MLPTTPGVVYLKLAVLFNAKIFAVHAQMVLANHTRASLSGTLPSEGHRKPVLGGAQKLRVKVEVAVLGSPSLIVPVVFVDVKQH